MTLPLPPDQRAGWTSQAVLPGLTAADYGPAPLVIKSPRFPLDEGVFRNDNGRCRISAAPDGTVGCLEYRDLAAVAAPSICEFHLKMFPAGVPVLGLTAEVWCQANYDWGDPAVTSMGGKLGLGLYVGSRDYGTGEVPPELQGGVSIRNIVSNGTVANSNRLGARISLYTYDLGRRVPRQTGGTMEGKKIGQKVSIALARGRWQPIAYEVALNTPGKANGIARKWLDGALVADLRQAILTLDGTWKILGPTFSDARNSGVITQDQSIWLRNIRCWLPPAGYVPVQI